VEQLKKDITSYATVYGYREVARYISEGSIAHVVIAEDADNTYKSKLAQLCDANDLPYRFLSSKEQLGKIAQLDVSCAVIGFAKALK